MYEGVGMYAREKIPGREREKASEREREKKWNAWLWTMTGEG